jgi:hypothetical protein
MVRIAAACDDDWYRQGGVGALQAGRQPGRGLAGTGAVVEEMQEQRNAALLNDILRNHPGMTREEAQEQIDLFG